MPYKKKPFPNWDKMVDMCDGASATGEDAFHPGEAILSAGESFQELDSANRTTGGEDANESEADEDANNSEGNRAGFRDFEACVCFHYSSSIYVFTHSVAKLYRTFPKSGGLPPSQSE